MSWCNSTAPATALHTGHSANTKTAGTREDMKERYSGVGKVSHLYSHWYLPLSDINTGYSVVVFVSMAFVPLCL